MSLLTKIPKVDRLLADPALAAIRENYPAGLILKAVRTVLENIRSEIISGSFEPINLEHSHIAAQVAAELVRDSSFSFRRVINATGTVIHTNLGRSPLPEKIAAHLTETALCYSNLEFDIASGERGDRYSHVESLICELTGAEAALVVNNNAAALLLALSSLAKGGEVIVSRGELVEIGGSFRIPDIMGQSGAILREVGTTNRTHLKDYKKGLCQETKLLLKVSCSNFAMIGYTAEVSHKQLAELGEEAGVPVMVDAGSGLFIDLEQLIGSRETTVREYIASGADVVACSGDKLLGGPQAGIIAGKREFVEPMKKHPLLRALRLDKMTLCALEGVLRLHRDERTALKEIPTLRMLTISADELKRHAARVLRRVRRSLPGSIRAELVSGFSMAGGGTLPTLQLPTKLVALHSENLSANQIEIMLRNAATPVIGRIYKDLFHLDTRTILDSDLHLLEESLKTL
ncbi:MAG: L-seryl-tRNA(Sec) selenium transferase [Geobacteraceae bacterium]|nr:L-seryl-tRNA(Sec) selenium transferase [Geobacteraceae bacterium]